MYHIAKVLIQPIYHDMIEPEWSKYRSRKLVSNPKQGKQGINQSDKLHKAVTFQMLHRVTFDEN